MGHLVGQNLVRRSVIPEQCRLLYPETHYVKHELLGIVPVTMISTG